MNLQSRVVNILTKPREEWTVIAAEPATIAEIYSGYVMILALIPPVCSFIGSSVLGIALPLVGPYRVGLAHGLTTAVLSYAMSLLGVYVAAVVIQKLAPTFQSESNLLQAFKLVAYSWTASWVAGVLQLFPMLGLLVLVAVVYGIYVCYLGMAPLLKTPQDKVIPFLVVAAVVSIVVTFVLGAITGAVTLLLFGLPPLVM